MVSNIFLSSSGEGIVSPGYSWLLYVLLFAQSPRTHFVGKAACFSQVHPSSQIGSG